MCNTIESYQRILNLSTVVTISPVPEPTHDVLYEGNLGNISPTIPLDISIKPRIVENVHIGASCSADEIQIYKALFQEFHDVFSWSYEEMPGIDPDIVVHEIKTYPMLNPFDRDFAQYIHAKLLLLNSKLKNFLKLVLSILWL
jgi:hypothetical protein